MAKQLSTNLDLIEDDEKITSSKIVNFFKGRTKYDIRANIWLSDETIYSLPHLFGINSNSDDIKIKHIKRIEIENVHIIKPDTMDDFMIFLFDNIPWTDSEQTPYSKIITLKTYHTESILDTLKNRKNTFCQNHSVPNKESVQIKSFSLHRLRNMMDEKCKIAKLSKFYKIETIKMGNVPFCVKLSDTTRNFITFRLETNNQRFEWMSHIDYVMKTAKKNKNDNFLDPDDIKDVKRRKSFVDNYSIDDDDEKSEFSNNFNFGIYLNYWDGSIIPSYDTLKRELLKNKIQRLNEEQYYELYELCKGLYSNRKTKQKVYDLKADHLGVTNKKCGIPKGTPITINHLIALKLYTNYTQHQKLFKMNCRKLKKDDTIKQLIKRNREIAHWSRYIKECCTFYGTLMTKKSVVYTGIDKKLIFNSLRQNFECPLSTTTSVVIANKFAQGTNGIILQMKRANTKTRYFDVSWLSSYPKEQERLFYGSSLGIVDILIRCKGSNGYVSAIHLFEKMFHGQFLGATDLIQKQLYKLIKFAMNIQTEKDKHAPSDYVRALFENMIQRMKINYGYPGIWINKYELESIKHDELRKILTSGRFCTFAGIAMNKIHSVKQFIWKLKDNEYEEFKNKRSREYIESSKQQYKLNDEDNVDFHFEICAKYSDMQNNCALFLHLDKLPKNVKEIKIEYEVLCILEKTNAKGRRIHKHLMSFQWLTKESTGKDYCGSQIFPFRDLEKYSCMTWKIGAKILDIEYRSNHIFNEMEVYNIDMDQEFNIEYVKDALQTNDTIRVLEMFQRLQTENRWLKDALFRQFEHQRSTIEKKESDDVTSIKANVNIPSLLNGRSRGNTLTAIIPRTSKTHVSPFASPGTTPPPLNENESADYGAVDVKLQLENNRSALSTRQRT
eukprot:174171_1